MSNQQHCRCGSGLPYEHCCELIHSGSQTAATAEILMRARYTAYAMHNGAFLLATWDRKSRPAKIDFSKETVEWQRLEIIDCKNGGVQDSQGVVEFKAYYLLEDELHVLYEISRFRKLGGRWCYLDGVIKSIAKSLPQSKQGRNAPFPCGSGKKFKRCCARN